MPKTMKLDLTKKQQKKLNGLSLDAMRGRVAMQAIADVFGDRERKVAENATAIVRKHPGCASLENVHHIGVGRGQKNAWIAVIAVEGGDDE